MKVEPGEPEAEEPEAEEPPEPSESWLHAIGDVKHQSMSRHVIHV